MRRGSPAFPDPPAAAVGGAIMADDVKLCDTCPWPIDCCTEEGVSRMKPVAVDCPRDHLLWERRLGQTRLDAITGTSIGQVVDIDADEVVLV